MTSIKYTLRKPLVFREIANYGDVAVALFKLSTIFFTIGYLTDGIYYFLSEKTSPLWINVFSLIGIWTLWGVYKAKKVNSNQGLIIHVIIVTLNLYLGIVYEATMGLQGSMLHVIECVCVCLVTAVLAEITTARWLPITITVGTISLYVFAGISMGNPDQMLSKAPVFTVLMLSIGYTFGYLLQLNKRITQENNRVRLEQDNIIHIFDFTPKQWELIKGGRMSRERLNKILLKANDELNSKMIHQIKHLVQTEEEIKNAVREVHPNLSPGDMELCALIVRGQTVSQIAKLQNIKTHSVTARRSRLRTRLGLTPEQNLNDYLSAIAKSKID